MDSAGAVHAHRAADGRGVARTGRAGTGGRRAGRDVPARPAGHQVGRAVLDELMRELSEHEPRRHGIRRALERMLDTIDLYDIVGTAGAARAELAEVLSKPAHASAHRISATGHAHIDSAWLWPLRETVR